MQRQSGICIELNQDRSIFLMKDGQFVTGTPVGKTSIGEEAKFYPFEKKTLIRRQPIIAPVVAAIAALALFMSVLVSPAEEAFGYVQIQINPGIELGVNEQHEVVSIRELNSDGEKLIHQLGDWKDSSLPEILNRVIGLAVTEKTKDITITAVEEEGKEIEDSIKKVAAEVSSSTDNENMAIHLKAATKKQWRQSKEKHVPVGKLIEESETLKKEKQPDVKKKEHQSDKKPIYKEETNGNKQGESDQNKKTDNREIDESNTSKDKKHPNAKKATPPAVEKKREVKEHQKNSKQNNESEKSSAQPKNILPEKKQEKVNPQPKAEPKQKAEPKPVPKPKVVPKEKPEPKPKEKYEPKQKPKEKNEKRGPENKGQGNSKAPGQQKKNHSPGNSDKRENNKDTHAPPAQSEKNAKDPDKKQKNTHEANGKEKSAKANGKENQEKE